jgi:hypothetical protein
VLRIPNSEPNANRDASCRSSTIPASSSSWRITQSSTDSMSRPSSAAACRNGASSAWERLAQCDPWVVPAPRPALIARAINNAPSHERPQRTGDHRSRCNPLGGLLPVGSNSHNRPERTRAGHVNAATSGLVEVDTAGPVWAISAGIITALVFPDRGGPSSSTARCERANRNVPSLASPRYAPPPSRCAISLIAVSGSSARASSLPATVAELQPAASAIIAITVATSGGTIASTTNPVVVRHKNHQAARPGMKTA